MLVRLIVFLFLNFGALAIGSIFTSKAVIGDWYLGLDKAPWTPPGWVFGAAWTTIMICFSWYMAYAWATVRHQKLLLGLMVVQWILNVSWNPVFFTFHFIVLGLFVITALTIVVTYLFFRFYPELKMKSILLLPYIIWLLIATSLNAYVVIYN